MSTSSASSRPAKRKASTTKRVKTVADAPVHAPEVPTSKEPATETMTSAAVDKLSLLQYNLMKTKAGIVETQRVTALIELQVADRKASAEYQKGAQLELELNQSKKEIIDRILLLQNALNDQALWAGSAPMDALSYISRLIEGGSYAANNGMLQPSTMQNGAMSQQNAMQNGSMVQQNAMQNGAVVQQNMMQWNNNSLGNGMGGNGGGGNTFVQSNGMAGMSMGGYGTGAY